MKVISRQIYLYDFHIFKLNNLKVIYNLYFHTKTLCKMTCNTQREGAQCLHLHGCCLGCTDLICIRQCPAHNKRKRTRPLLPHRPARKNKIKRKRPQPTAASLIGPRPPARIRVWTWLNLRHSFTCVYNTRYTVVTPRSRAKKRKIAASLIASPPSPCTSGSRTWRVCNVMVVHLQHIVCPGCNRWCLYKKLTFGGREKGKGIQTKKHLGGTPRTQIGFSSNSLGAAASLPSPPPRRPLKKLRD
jgi:hypothetical protein